MTATLKKDCRAPLAMTNTTSPPEECKHHSSLRGASATRQSHPPPVLARSVSDTAISPSPRHCEERSDVAILPSKKRIASPFRGSQWRQHSRKPRYQPIEQEFTFFFGYYCIFKEDEFVFIVTKVNDEHSNKRTHNRSVRYKKNANRYIPRRVLLLTRRLSQAGFQSVLLKGLLSIKCSRTEENWISVK